MARRLIVNCRCPLCGEQVEQVPDNILKQSPGYHNTEMVVTRRRLILFLVRRKLGLRKYEQFRFANQKSERNFYYFGNYAIKKVVIGPKHELDIQHVVPSNVSLNYLLSDECEVVKVKWE